MKTFKQFLIEGKKSKLKQQLMHQFLTHQNLNPPPVQNFGIGTAPNSPERAAAIAKLMKVQGGAAVKEAAKRRQEDAKKYAKSVLKNKKA